MGTLYVFLIIAGIFLAALIVDRLFKYFSCDAYIQFLKRTGLEIKIFQFSWTTTAFNSLLIKWGSSCKRFLNFWFYFGVCPGLILLPFSICFLLFAFSQNFSSLNLVGYVIQLVLPALNLPGSTIGYYFFTLIISSVLHELGHALAAVQEDVPLINVGAHIFFILPVAYVNINSDKLFSLNSWRRLKILCAGIWHNLLIVLVAYLLYILLPFIFLPFFRHSKGIIVSQMQDNSPISGDRGLHVGDQIFKINECDTPDDYSWYKCLITLNSQPSAFCIEGDVVHNLDKSVNLNHLESEIVSCCHSDNKGKLCFEYLGRNGSILELPPYACLPGRTAIEASTSFCTSDPHVCQNDTYCFGPIWTNSIYLFRIRRTGQMDVVYMGYVSDFVTTMVISPYIPKYSFLSTDLPDVTAKFLGYLVVISFEFAVVNSLPCIFMDGQHITNTLLRIVLPDHLTTHFKALSTVITASFTLLLIIHCIIVWAK